MPSPSTRPLNSPGSSPSSLTAPFALLETDRVEDAHPVGFLGRVLVPGATLDTPVAAGGTGGSWNLGASGALTAAPLRRPLTLTLPLALTPPLDPDPALGPDPALDPVPGPDPALALALALACPSPSPSRSLTIQSLLGVAHRRAGLGLRLGRSGLRGHPVHSSAASLRDCSAPAPPRCRSEAAPSNASASSPSIP